MDGPRWCLGDVYVCDSFCTDPLDTGLLGLLGLAACFGLGKAMVTSSAAAPVAEFCKEAHLGSAMGAFGTRFDAGHASGPLLVGFLIGLSGGSDF